MTEINFNTEELLSAFKQLVELVGSLVQETKVKRLVEPSVSLMSKCKVLQYSKTGTGISVSQTQQEFIQREDWFKASMGIFDQIKASPQYRRFQEQIPDIDPKRPIHYLDDAIRIISSKSFNGERINAQELLRHFLDNITKKPIRSWNEIDVYGISLGNVPVIKITSGRTDLFFRQLDVPDFEFESYVNQLSQPRFRMPPPSLILRIEMNAKSGHELQVEARKAEALLRLFQVCSLTFHRHALGSVNPFAMIIGVVTSFHSIVPVSHSIILTSDSPDELQHFWDFVEPKLPPELSDFTPSKVTPVSIAYERYCDSLQHHPIERKITFAIMGLEAIYLQENEVQELMYRLQLRVCKTLSKLGFNFREVRLCIKEGYAIRNKYVHGGHLSEKDKKRLMERQSGADQLCSKLLNFLRISILHLVISKQSKADFLDFIEDSLIERGRDQEFESMLASERVILRR